MDYAVVCDIPPVLAADVTPSTRVDCLQAESIGLLHDANEVC